MYSSGHFLLAYSVNVPFEPLLPNVLGRRALVYGIVPSGSIYLHRIIDNLLLRKSVPDFRFDFLQIKVPSCDYLVHCRLNLLQVSLSGTVVPFVWIIDEIKKLWVGAITVMVFPIAQMDHK